MASVLIYSTAMCPYCVRARHLLERKGVGFEEIRVDLNPALRVEMQQRSGRHTVPQIWIGATHIGGCNELYELEYGGQLDTLLQAADDTPA